MASALLSLLSAVLHQVVYLLNDLPLFPNLSDSDLPVPDADAAAVAVVVVPTLEC